LWLLAELLLLAAHLLHWCWTAPVLMWGELGLAAEALLGLGFGLGRALAE
jgi:hypothetical protein